MNSVVLRRFHCTTSVAAMSSIRYCSGRAGAGGAGAAVGESHGRRSFRCVTPSGAASEATNKVMDAPTTASWVAGRAGKMRMSRMAGKFSLFSKRRHPSIASSFVLECAHAYIVRTFAGGGADGSAGGGGATSTSSGSSSTVPRGKGASNMSQRQALQGDRWFHGSMSESNIPKDYDYTKSTAANYRVDGRLVSALGWWSTEPCCVSFVSHFPFLPCIRTECVALRVVV